MYERFMKQGITPLWNRNIWNWLPALRDRFITIVIYYDTSGSCAAFLRTSSYCYYPTSITPDARNAVAPLALVILFRPITSDVCLYERSQGPGRN